MEKRNIDSLESYITRDNSEIFELFHPQSSDVENLSLALARVAEGESTRRHYHQNSEEIYYVLAGKGKMFLEGSSGEIYTGDCVYIPPGQKHYLENHGQKELLILCASSPPYSHTDTRVA